MEKDLDSIMVSIRCYAYNHENYIAQCLEGFVMQKTTFRFEAIVHDDASTDGTAAIIREYAEKYPDIIKPIYETENQFSKHDGSLGRIMKVHTHGKYIAYCEGDDYWIDPYKLQKQVNILESHPDVTMVYTAFQVVDDKSVPKEIDFYKKCMNKSHSGWAFEKLLQRNFILTLTTVFPTKIVNESNNNIDYKLFLYAARVGKAVYLEDRTSNYRINPTSIQHTNKELVSDGYEKALFLEIKEYVKYKSNTTHPILLNNFRLKCLIARIIISKIKRYKKLRKEYLLLLLVRPWYLLWTIIAIVKKI